MALTPQEVALRLNSLPSDQSRALTALFDKLISDVAAVTAGEVSSDTITDASDVGKDVLTAANAAAARTAIGVVDATTEEAGLVLQAETQADSTAADVAGIKTDFNALLAKLQAAGLMA